MQIEMSLMEAAEMLTYSLRDRLSLNYIHVVINSPEAAPKPAPINQHKSFESVEEVMSLAQWDQLIGTDNNRKIHWIKMIRSLVQMSLYDAKQFVEACMTRNQLQADKEDQDLKPKESYHEVMAAERDVNAGKVQI